MNIDKAIKIWHKRIDTVSAIVNKEFSSLTPEQLNWKLSFSEWSIAEVLEHLNLMNASYAKVLSDAESEKSDMGFTSKIDFVVTFLGNMIYESVEPTRAKKMKTFAV
jgi:hypothetical protein